MAITRRKERTKFRHQALNPLLEVERIEMTIPDKPRSGKQQYRLTHSRRPRLAGVTRHRILNTPNVWPREGWGDKIERNALAKTKRELTWIECGKLSGTVDSNEPIDQRFLTRS